ncbi:hypothetical protein Ddye_023216 [Dipteronia dyeriana]|uniref:Transposase n=1 Tax=Dipteronia dyeriana TaxID=168575 RepID=A0AAD9TTI7_9ROSI|nr:hypothetical protein Ddye_023216 [Dipteronia dyeriana]
MATKMIEKFEKYWDVIQGVMVVAIMLDPSSDGPTHVKSEYDAYLEENVLPRTKDFEILVWWRANASKYPILAQIARDFLAIPVSSVASESAFSTCGRIVSLRRNRLHPDTLEALILKDEGNVQKLQQHVIHHFKKRKKILKRSVSSNFPHCVVLDSLTL